jgi:DNA-binding response OmpR family regulator
MAKIFLVDDDPELLGSVKDWLAKEGHVVEVAADGKEALDRLKFYQYDLIVLDWQLPEASGIEVLEAFRSSGGTTPVIMLTGKTTLPDKEEGLGAGADDYICKPFHVRELSARIKAVLRRPSSLTGSVLEAGHIRLDTVQHQVFVDGKEIHLHRKEFALLEFLLKHPGQVFSQGALLDRVWSSYSDVSPESVYVYMTRLRKKIDIADKPPLIRTHHGVGYVLDIP